VAPGAVGVMSVSVEVFDVPRSRLPGWLKYGLAAVAIAALLVLLWSVWDHEAVMSWVERAPPIPFFGVMALLPAIGVPITPFFILAGATFGKQLGLLGSAIALAVNLVGCYSVARRLRPWIEKLLRRLGQELPDLGDRERSPWRFTLALKLAPGVPQFVKNYALGVAGVPFALYFAASLVITGFYGAGLILLGDSLLHHEWNRTLVVVAVVAVIVMGVWGWFRHRSRRAGDLRARR
jgi:uncharacterized membrane protein YdjX (TVP38/TMEM64 family)